MHYFVCHLAGISTVAWLMMTQGALCLRAADRPLGEQAGNAKIIRRAEVIPNGFTNSPPQGGLWSLYATPEARLNYFAVTGHTPMHFHPDAEHRLYVLEGKVLVTAGTNTTVASVGDFIVIPRGVRHGYDVPMKGERALMLTFDAPPFDPRKTVSVEPPAKSNQ
jgi:mannose-6-phosphate isomerase-like protein (cupin superfamily)